MYTPSSYPCFIFYFDGSQFHVETPADLANMWPGYANNPAGPFTEMAQGWKWQIWPEEGMHGGPYAPDKTKYRYERGIQLEALVYTEKPRVVDGVQRNTSEVWRRGSPEVERGIREGVVYVVPPGALLATSAKSGRCLLGDEARDAYDRRYDKRDLTGFERDVPSPPDAARAPETASLGVAPDVEPSIDRTVYRLIRPYRGIKQDGTESILPLGTLIERSRVAAWGFPADSRELVTLHLPLNQRQPQPPVYRAVFWYRLRGDLHCPIGEQLVDMPDHALVEPRSRLCRAIQSLGMNLLEPIAALIPLTPEPVLDSAVPQSEPAPEAESMPAPEDTPHAGALDRLPTDAQLLRVLKRAARELRKEGRPVTQQNLGRKLTPLRGRNKVGEYLKQLGLKATDL